MSRVRRLHLSDGAWVDHRSHWLSGHQVLFRQLADGLDWRQASRRMYDRVVDVPRLIARVPDDDRAPPVIAAMATVLSHHYGRPLFQVSANWYRDGRDSVAPHGDRVPHRADTLIAIVSLGHPRRLILRPVRRRVSTAPTSHAFDLGLGDLLVMGGTCQETWEHGVPKAAAAGPRISVIFRQGLPD
ncbi:MAG: alpha-ketoglutarate-dependent dioxygenase AlkB [Deltaproteobacteria bacterium]|nr:MAG: alpha-ketoglutarate-dependent dioxygenase AlkB [Deltaproteobacteria bacterium]